MKPMELPGLARLLDVCERLELGFETSPPDREPMTAGSLLEGVPLDPVLANVYARLGHAAFATKVMRWGLDRCDDRENRLKENNKGWRELYWNDLGTPVIVFGGGIYAYATVPDLADARGRQPVVEVNTYEIDGLHVVPVASDVDRFFDTYSRYLEALVTDPYYLEIGRKLIFPWDASEILARDERLVELMLAGRFEPLMKNADEETRRWAAKVMGAGE